MRGFRGHRRALVLLRRHCPAPRPVRVVFARMDDYGDTARVGPGFVVRIRAGLGKWDGLHAISHEWAHAVAWHRSRLDHGPAWALAYSRAYRVLVDGWRPRRRA